MGDTGQHEGVLHVDHDQGGLLGIEIVVDVLAPAPLDDALDDGFGNGKRVHRSNQHRQGRDKMIWR